MHACVHPRVWAHTYTVALTQFCVRSKATPFLYSRVISISTEPAVSCWLRMWDLDENTSVGILALSLNRYVTLTSKSVCA